MYFERNGPGISAGERTNIKHGDEGQRRRSKLKKTKANQNRKLEIQHKVQVVYGAKSMYVPLR